MILTAPTFFSILTGLKATIAQVASKSVPAQLALLNFIYGRITRNAARFERLFTRWQTNTLPKPRPSRPNTKRPATRREKPPLPDLQTTVWAAMTTPPCPLPGARAWLRNRLRSAHANIYASQLETFLSTPELTQFRAEVPSADRLLRPLCHMLGISLQVMPIPEAISTRSAATPKPRPPHPTIQPSEAKPKSPDPPPPIVFSSA